ncbi:proteasomal ubiquitin receptor ADRM1-like protein [Sarcoptes scabiei]|uniref:Proteasomal ubiquitin receptor ADRM1-like protein n=1 Tax=Sarcoptes scabiei TaxID=52283 RepID=A0A132ABJ0_SARSC|nr:proteasomal ubiquitin receptor ADRM1-like protein [Sarcoptes scabiei]
MHFCWKDRTTGQLEDDLIIFPDDAEFLKVPQCTSGRVFVLKFKTSPRRLFFWSQEPKDDKDDEIVSKINDYINNPMAASRSSGPGLMSNSDLSAHTEDEFRSILSNSSVSAQQLMSMLDAGMTVIPNNSRLSSLLGSVTNASSRNSSSNVSTPAAPQTPSSTPAITSSNSTSESSSTTGDSNPTTCLRLADLQNIISGLSSNVENQGQDVGVNVDLSTSLNLEVLRPLLLNEDFMKRISDTLPPIAEANKSNNLAEQFTSTVQSPQFQQALNSFSSALQSGQLGPLIQQFGLPEDCVVAANTGNFEAFVRALQAKNSTEKSSSADNSSSEKQSKKNDDDSMALD